MHRGYILMGIKGIRARSLSGGGGELDKLKILIYSFN